MRYPLDKKSIRKGYMALCGRNNIFKSILTITNFAVSKIII